MTSKIYSWLIFIAIGALVFSCTRVGNEELARYWWKNGSANQEGAVLIFSNEKPEDGTNACWISGDTIYYNNEPNQLVTGTYKKNNGSINLYVVSFETGISSTYHSKVRHTENR